jgi:hypothetical protein
MFPLTFRERVGSRVQGTNFHFFEYFYRNTLRTVFTRRSHGMDAAAQRTVIGTESAGNAKGVFYDN